MSVWLSSADRPKPGDRSGWNRRPGGTSRARRSALAAGSLALLTICSCGGAGTILHPIRAPQAAMCPAGGPMAGAGGLAGPMVAGGPTPGDIAPGMIIPGGMAPGGLLGQLAPTQWSPPGIALPWPHDEYLADGGDKEVPVTVNRQGQVNGLELEDTVAHYDTIDGRTLVEPSNRVNIYAPRFAAVRSVEETRLRQSRDQAAGSHSPTGPQVEVDRWLATTALQREQPVGDVGVKQPSLAHLRQGRGVLLTRELPYATQDRMSAYEDFEIIRLGTFDDAEKPRLMESVDAAIVWSADQALQVVIDNVEAKIVASDEKVEATYRVDLPMNPKLRVVKVASTNQARPGDVIEFTIRFDNVGDAAIGNVTLIDNLTTRLEYVEGSAKSSRDGQFFADPNQGDSLALRWEIAEPLDPGQGGLVRFKCRVR